MLIDWHLSIANQVFCKIAVEMAQWQSVGIVIKRLLAAGSIPELAVLCRVLGKDILRLFLIGLSSLSVVVDPE